MIKKKNYCQKIKKDYQAKKLANPFFRKKEKKPEGRAIKTTKIILLFLILPLFIIWFLFLSPWLSISNIDILGTEIIQSQAILNTLEEDLTEKKLGIFQRNNILIFNKKLAASHLQEEFNLAAIVIKKRFPNKIIIEISERPYAFIYKEQEDYYFSSDDNYLMAKIAFNQEAQEGSTEVEGQDIDLVLLTEEEKQKYFIIENKNTTSLINDSDKIKLTSDYVNFILNLKRELEVYPELPLDKFIIADQYFNSVFVKIKEGPQIYFNVNKDIKVQLENLILVKNDKIKDNFNNLEYIDLRYGDKIYFFPENIVN